MFIMMEREVDIPAYTMEGRTILKYLMILPRLAQFVFNGRDLY